MAFWQGIRASFSVFYSYLLDEFPWGRGEAALAQSISFVMYMASVPFIGGMIDRFGPRKIVVPGILLSGGGLLLCSAVRDIGTFYLFYGVLVGLGTSFYSIVTYSTILAHWFNRKRGLASGIASAGMGAGTFFLVTLAEKFSGLFGWRIAFVLLGLMVLFFLLPSNGLFLRHRPEDMGMGPDGIPLPSKSGATMDLDSKGFFYAIKDRKFWFLVSFASSSLFSIQILLTHNVRFLLDKGISRDAAAFSFAWVGLVSAAFRIFWGWLSDRIGRELSYTLGAICIALSVFFLMMVDPQRISFLYLFVLFFGIGWGATAPSFMAVAADLFEGRQFGFIYGFFEASMYVTSVIGVWLAGYLFDVTHSYAIALFLVTISIILSILFIWITAPRKHKVFN